jgi:hypothetical protein
MLPRIVSAFAIGLLVSFGASAQDLPKVQFKVIGPEQPHGRFERRRGAVLA